MLTSSRRSYGLAWSPLKQGHILAASEDQTVCEWDVNQYKKSDNVLEPLKTYRGHTAVVEVRFREQRQAKARKRAQADVPPPPPGAQDVAWHASHESLFASVGDDKLLLL
jgi:histone-binding protein RBBP4